jgi:hypothetical protein
MCYTRTSSYPWDASQPDSKVLSSRLKSLVIVRSNASSVCSVEIILESAVRKCASARYTRISWVLSQSQLAPNVSSTVYLADAGSGHGEENRNGNSTFRVVKEEKEHSRVVEGGEQESDIVFSVGAAETDLLSVH